MLARIDWGTALEQSSSRERQRISSFIGRLKFAQHLDHQTAVAAIEVLHDEDGR